MADQPIAVDPDLHVINNTHYPDDWQSFYLAKPPLSDLRFTEVWWKMADGTKHSGTKTISFHPTNDNSKRTKLDILLLSSWNRKETTFLRSPIGDSPRHILDIGTGQGTWAIDVADMFPSATVRGVDLFPPLVSWTPPNCILEVDDVQQDWTWRERFDLIHMRIMIGSFDGTEWDNLYKQCFDKIRPGGWIEQLEVSPIIETDGSLPPENILNDWGPNVLGCGERAGRDCDTFDTMTRRIRSAGFVDVHEKNYKWPIGPWPRDQKLKDAGTINFQHWINGMEGWCMWLLTKFGHPQPWDKDEVHVYVAKLRKELKDSRFHIWHQGRRVWARKPMPSETPDNPTIGSTGPSFQQST
ncbi:hypothetical protein DTO027I6_9607 [Penicillium roqueforti]|nr:hypothetical protein CBS147337_9787 [Penicillium roqueforti]KAI3185967.1 hypothetical protein DTO027I6_9607 [Penicillium roqueforti]